MTMVNCIRFVPKDDCKELIFKETSKIFKTLDGALEKRLIRLGDGEYASIIIWKSMDEFLDVLNRDIRLIDVLRPLVKSYNDGEKFHSFSGPTVDLSMYEN